ncbi:hypothetical protein E4T39_03142 [Aureobasidium subglaciale]|nr:hypothetical protein E4T39_03142 [Aureobasidium subglaciale]
MVGHKHVKCTPHQGLHAHRKERLLLQYVLNKDAEIYEAKLVSDIHYVNGMTYEEARVVVEGAYKASANFEEHFKDSLQLYHAFLAMLASPRLALKPRLHLHQLLAKTKSNRDDAIYHADVALEMVLKASDIPVGPEFKHNTIVNTALTLDLKVELESATRLLQFLNGGERTNVCWNRLAQGGEEQRIWVES